MGAPVLKGRLRLLSIVALGITASPAFAADAPLKVLRHMTFDVAYDVRTKIDTKVSGFNGSAEASGSVSGSGPTSDAHGTISVDVVAATGDGGLVVDVSEDADHHEPPVRVGITDSTLFYDRNAIVTEEERLLLHYLARDFVKATELTTTTTWDEKTQDAGATQRTTYKVTSVDATTKMITLGIAGSSSTTGYGASQGTTTGTMTYDTGTLVPVKLSLATRSTMQSGAHVTTVDAQLTSTLRDDTFRKS